MGPEAGLARAGARGSLGHVAESRSRAGHGLAYHSWGPGGETLSRVGTWQDEGVPFCANFSGDGYPISPRWNFTVPSVPVGSLDPGRHK